MCFTNLSINHNFFLTSLFCAQVGVTWLKNNLKRFFILMIPDRKWKFNVTFFLCLLWINCSRSYPGLHEILTKLKASIERGCVNLQVPLISDLHPRKVCKALPSYDSSNFFLIWTFEMSCFFLWAYVFVNGLSFTASLLIKPPRALWLNIVIAVTKYLNGNVLASFSCKLKSRGTKISLRMCKSFVALSRARF